MHTTASDGRLPPAELVARVATAGLTTISVTDHDTVAALDEVRTHARAYGVSVVTGIEVTSVHDGRDVHVLGYFFNAEDAVFARFLEEQRGQRVARVRAIAERLSSLGCPINVDEILAEAARRPGAAVGRPRIARALIDAGYVRTHQEAFDEYLASGRAAFVPRIGASPAAVIAAIHAAGGIASLAHPGVTGRPDLIGPLAEAGLDAIEVYHSDHTPTMQQAALEAAHAFNLAISGGSDHHGEADRRPLGAVTLAQADFEALEARARR